MFATANVSGGHLNPAVTLGTIISGHIPWRRGLLYMLAQFLGGIVGGLPGAGHRSALLLKAGGKACQGAQKGRRSAARCTFLRLNLVLPAPCAAA